MPSNLAPILERLQTSRDGSPELVLRFSRLFRRAADDPLRPAPLAPLVAWFRAARHSRRNIIQYGTAVW